MSDFQVTLLAQADIDLAWLYIARDRPAAADRLAQRFFEQFAAIANNPAMGHVCAELGTEIRQSTVGKYVVIYRIRESWVDILRVIHGARDVIAEFKRHWPESI